MSNMFSIGKSYINSAVEYDRNKDYENAIHNYKEGVRVFILVIKCKHKSVETIVDEKNPYTCKAIKEKCVEYMDRIEELSKLTDPKKKVENPSADGTKEGGEEPSELRRQLLDVIITERPTIKWEDVAGLEMAKEELRVTVILPIIHPELFVGKRKPWSGILLYGPPGTGKSYLAKAVASQASSTFFSVSSSDLVSKWQGESARLVKELFTLAREKRPSIVFIDEIDSLCGNRDDSSGNAGQRQVLTELLVQIDGVGKNQDGVLVLGATNVPWDIDPAMRRRFQKRIYIPLPDVSARKVMFKIHFGKEGHSLTDPDFEYLATQTEGFSGSDIANVAKQALNYPIRVLQKAEWFRKDTDGFYDICKPTDPGAENTTVYKLPKGEVYIPLFTKENIPKVLKKAVKATSQKELARYTVWTSEFGEEGA